MYAIEGVIINILNLELKQPLEDILRNIIAVPGNIAYGGSASHLSLLLRNSKRTKYMHPTYNYNYLSKSLQNTSLQ